MPISIAERHVSTIHEPSSVTQMEAAEGIWRALKEYEILFRSFPLEALGNLSSVNRAARAITFAQQIATISVISQRLRDADKRIKFADSRTPLGIARGHEGYLLYIDADGVHLGVDSVSVPWEDKANYDNGSDFVFSGECFKGLRSCFGKQRMVETLSPIETAMDMASHLAKNLIKK